MKFHQWGLFAYTNTTKETYLLICIKIEIIGHGGAGNSNREKE